MPGIRADIIVVCCLKKHNVAQGCALSTSMTMIFTTFTSHFSFLLTMTCTSQHLLRTLSWAHHWRWRPSSPQSLSCSLQRPPQPAWHAAIQPRLVADCFLQVPKCIAPVSAHASPICMACSNLAKTGCMLLLTSGKSHCPSLLCASACVQRLSAQNSGQLQQKTI